MADEAIERLLHASESFLGPLRSGEGLKRSEFDQLCAALKTCAEVWTTEEFIPKELASILVDLWPGIQSTAYLYGAPEANEIMQAADIVGDLTRQVFRCVSG